MNISAIVGTAHINCLLFTVYLLHVEINDNLYFSSKNLLL